MAKGYSKDLRARAVALVEDGESRREAARVLGLGASTAIRWIERWTTTGSVAALPGTGHSRSPRAAQVREAAENRDDLGLALLRTPRHHVQKKLCTPLNKIVLMSLQRVPN